MCLTIIAVFAFYVRLTTRDKAEYINQANKAFHDYVEASNKEKEALMNFVKDASKDKSKLINALVSKSHSELRDLEMTDKLANLQVPSQTQPSDLVPMDQLTEAEFEDHIKESLHEPIE